MGKISRIFVIWMKIDDKTGVCYTCSCYWCIYLCDPCRMESEMSDTPGVCRTPDSTLSTGSGLSHFSLSGSNNPYYRLPQKLKIIKPLEGIHCQTQVLSLDTCIFVCVKAVICDISSNIFSHLIQFFQQIIQWHVSFALYI